MSQKTLEVVLTATGEIDIKGPEEIIGWGEDGHELRVVGSVADIRVLQAGEDKFSLRILGDGRLVLTSYCGAYDTGVPQNLTLRPGRPWKAAEAKRVSDE